MEPLYILYNTYMIHAHSKPKKDRQGFSLCIPAGSVVSALSALSPEAVDWSKVPRGPKRVGLGPKKPGFHGIFIGFSWDFT
jgi:hypothetical protein